MSKPTYYELLRDPRWQKKRLEILNRSNFTCEECCANDKTLNVHHIQYRKGASPWEYEDHELLSLCEECHALRHDLEKKLKTIVGFIGLESLRKVIGFTAAEACFHNAVNVELSEEASLRGFAGWLYGGIGSQPQMMERILEIQRRDTHITPAELNTIANEFINPKAEK